MGLVSPPDDGNDGDVQPWPSACHDLAARANSDVHGIGYGNATGPGLLHEGQAWQQHVDARPRAFPPSSDGPDSHLDESNYQVSQWTTPTAAVVGTPGHGQQNHYGSISPSSLAVYPIRNRMTTFIQNPEGFGSVQGGDGNHPVSLFRTNNARNPSSIGPDPSITSSIISGGDNGLGWPHLTASHDTPADDHAARLSAAEVAATSELIPCDIVPSYKSIPGAKKRRLQSGHTSMGSSEEARRREVAETRKRKACLRCRFQKLRVS